MSIWTQVLFVCVIIAISYKAFFCVYMCDHLTHYSKGYL